MSRGLLIAICLAGVAWPVFPTAREPAALEYRIKAAFLYHFTKFARWPESAFEAAASPLVICVTGEDPFGSVLEETVAGKTAQDRPLEIRQGERLEDLGRCHLLFVSPSERKHLAQIFAALDGAPVLTVGEVPEFLFAGGIVNFVVRDDRVQFDIRLPTEGTGLKLSSQLLKLVKTGKPGRKDS